MSFVRRECTSILLWQVSDDDFDDLVQQNRAVTPTPSSLHHYRQQQHQQPVRPATTATAFDQYAGVESGVINRDIKLSPQPNFSSHHALLTTPSPSSRGRRHHPEKPKRANQTSSAAAGGGGGILKSANQRRAHLDSSTSDYSESSESTNPGNISSKLLVALEKQQQESTPEQRPIPSPRPRPRHTSPLTSHDAVTAAEPKPAAEVGEVKGMFIYTGQ